MAKSSFLAPFLVLWRIGGRLRLSSLVKRVTPHPEEGDIDNDAVTLEAEIIPLDTIGTIDSGGKDTYPCWARPFVCPSKKAA